MLPIFVEILIASKDRQYIDWFISVYDINQFGVIFSRIYRDNAIAMLSGSVAATDYVRNSAKPIHEFEQRIITGSWC